MTLMPNCNEWQQGEGAVVGRADTESWWFRRGGRGIRRRSLFAAHGSNHPSSGHHHHPGTAREKFLRTGSLFRCHSLLAHLLFLSPLFAVSQSYYACSFYSSFSYPSIIHRSLLPSSHPPPHPPPIATSSPSAECSTQPFSLDWAAKICLAFTYLASPAIRRTTYILLHLHQEALGVLCLSLPRSVLP
ncbi:hypothetical protein EX30DRAFT_183660 [Ascodesmis nigricans]|uniref:Uncharacterized protein n=1 Tax=Ascodesmis nigricans TaxID=341454 RepID=A0A4S2MZX6_9PEZI|nr:hypothetical protein EX30DRAFT_183660 [Ascodesmis nigricans]